MSPNVERVLPALSLVALLSPPILAGTPPAGFTERTAVPGLSTPTDLTFSPLDRALWITQQTGEIYLYRDPGPAVLVITIPVDNFFERGLLGFAFDPVFTTNHYVYVYYTTDPTISPTRNRVARYVEANDTLTFDRLLIDDIFVNAGNHNGGVLKFGLDGKLYVGVGENANPGNAQDLTNPKGKVLRINSDGTIPIDNPFLTPPNDGRIWCYGLRNPWRLDFDSANGDLYIGDVGQNTTEEIDYGLKGFNYHWPQCEGTCASGTGFENPIWEYPNGGGGAVTGGPTYRGANFPAAYTGRIFYGDYVQGFVRTLTIDANHQVTADNPFVNNADSPVDIEIGPDGCLYYVSYGSGNVFQVCFDGPPVADFSGTPTSGNAPLPVQFSNLTSGAVNSYSWDFGDGGTSTLVNPSHTYNAPGTYTVALTATGPGGSDTNTKPGYITVTVNAPVADFSAAPLTGPAPLAVAFTDMSTGPITTWAWDFGDGGTSATQNPGHTYLAAGSYTVALTVTGPGGSDTMTRPNYVIVTAIQPANLVTGLGPDGTALPRVQAWDNTGQPFPGIDFNAYGSGGFGVNVARGNLDGNGTEEILTGPGPSGSFGPQVRAFFTPTAQPVAKINYYAYGTLKFGVRAEGGNLDGDGSDEIVTSPGPGAAFGPHVRGWNWDGGSLTAIAKISFFAFSTLKYGARATGGSIDLDPFAEIVVGPGPGAVFGCQVRGFNYDNAAIASIGKVNYFAYSGLTFGTEVAVADLDADAPSEILTGPGQAQPNPTNVRGWNYDATAISALPGLDFTAYAPSQYGVLVSGGDVDGDGHSEVLTMPADPGVPAHGLGWDYESGAVTPISAIDFIADPSKRSGGNIDAGDLGF
ncbi:MAG: PQQ-dependent sugar dehydrogenase [Acidobacteriota bacterium]